MAKNRLIDADWLHAPKPQWLRDLNQNKREAVEQVVEAFSSQLANLLAGLRTPLPVDMTVAVTWKFVGALYAILESKDKGVEKREI